MNLRLRGGRIGFRGNLLKDGSVPKRNMSHIYVEGTEWSLCGAQMSLTTPPLLGSTQGWLECPECIGRYLDILSWGLVYDASE